MESGGTMRPVEAHGTDAPAAGSILNDPSIGDLSTRIPETLSIHRPVLRMLGQPQSNHVTPAVAPEPRLPRTARSDGPRLPVT